MPDSDHIAFRADEELRAMVEDYKTAKDLPSESESARELIRVGYHEAHHPILYRLKDLGLLGAFVMFMGSLAVIPFGYLTSLLTPVQTWLITISLAAMGVFWLASMELVRYAREWV